MRKKGQTPAHIEETHRRHLIARHAAIAQHDVVQREISALAGPGEVEAACARGDMLDSVGQATNTGARSARFAPRIEC